MQNYYVRDIVRATGGTLLCGDPDTLVTSCSTDSNTIEPGALFVPIIGARVDAHTFIDSAIANGAVATLTSEHDEMDGPTPYIRVSNTTMALQNMSRDYGKRIIMPKIGVTGSVGKTTTKEMIACALSAQYSVFKTAGNYNSQIGMPLTLLRMTDADQIAVIEMGIGMRGEMVRLAELIDLNDAVVTNIGVSHIEQLKTQDGIAQEKLHIEDAIKDEDGVIFLNGDDEILMRHAKELKHRVLTYGLNASCDYFASGIKVNQGGIDFTVTLKNRGSYKARIQVLGEHNVRNALVAIAVAERHGVDPRVAMEALAHYEAFSMRGQMFVADGITIVDDSYNASPDSMKAGIKMLCSIPTVTRRIAVLADMLELGEEAAKYHEEVGAYIAQSDIHELVTYGELSTYIDRGASANTSIRITHCATREEVDAYLQENKKPGDAIYFKGSRGMKLNDCVDRLKPKNE